MSASGLQTATSQYLRLHKDNPVQWRLWGAAALAEAREQNKPIFLSTGYTACHWCHVMNAESFSDAATAALINDNFIPIIADRDERPDVDQLYQAASNVMGHNGGWPLNIFLTPAGLPYFVVGFLPREERMGQPAFGKVLTDMAAMAREQPERMQQQALTVMQQLDPLFNRDMRGDPNSVGLDAAAVRIGQRFDIFMGGMIGAMKFPSVTLVEVLWRAFLRTGASQYLQLVTGTMDNVLLGGLYDHIGGGFFRYTNDERWMVPHFEKMLYDTALLIDFMTGMWQYNRNEICRQRVEESIGWMLREMKLGDAFAAGIDADSAMEDGKFEEGKYYVWSEAEIDAALAGTFSQRFKQVYGVTRDGNWMGKTVLRRLGNAAGQVSEADEALLAKQRGLLLAARNKRTRPQRDEKLLTDWNGLAIHALAMAGSVFERPDWIAAAIAAYDDVVRQSGEGDTLYHSWAEGQHGEKGFADDYAHMARAALQLWESTGEARFLGDARRWVATLDGNFWDEVRGGYCFTSNAAEPLIIRTRMIFDQPVPSSNATMISVLTRLALITGETDYRTRGEALLIAFVDEINRAYISCGEYLNGYECFASALQIVVVGPRNNARTQEFIRAIWGRALPNRLLYVVDTTEQLPTGHPAFGQPMQNGQPTVYICQRTQCSQPITSPVTLSQMLTLPPQRQG